MNVKGLDFSKIYKVIDNDLDQFIISKFSGILNNEGIWDKYECPVCEFYVSNIKMNLNFFSPTMTNGCIDSSDDGFIFRKNTWITTNEREIIEATESEAEWLLLCYQENRPFGLDVLREIKINMILKNEIQR